MEFLLLVPVLIASVVLHEVAHAWQARREGDTTAEREGRITLNPVPHVDPIGTVAVPALLWFSGAGFLFGWAKPVPVDPRNYRDPKWGDVRVSLAGIAVNLALAVLCTLAMALLVAFAPRGAVAQTTFDVLRWGLLLNLILAFFNLLPIPPLDGSHVAYHLLPGDLGRKYRALGRYGMLILFALFFIPGAFDVLLWPVDLAMGAADRFVRLWI
jgi:Zn-dependent protease